MIDTYAMQMFGHIKGKGGRLNPGANWWQLCDSVNDRNLAKCSKHSRRGGVPNEFSHLSCTSAARQEQNKLAIVSRVAEI